MSNTPHKDALTAEQIEICEGLISDKIWIDFRKKDITKGDIELYDYIALEACKIGYYAALQQSKSHSCTDGNSIQQ
jgi:hypothetical protein